MSFDIFFQPCRYGDKPVEKKNPFTGKAQSVLPNEPLTPAELNGVQTVLREAKARGPDRHGCYVVEFGDGGGAEVYGKDLQRGCMAAIRGLTPDLLRFLIELLKAGNWVMTPAMEDGGAITSSPAHLKGVPSDFPRIVVCNSAEELGTLLSKGVGAWEAYRNQTAGGRG